ncbi:septum formation protein Maf [Candidatus Peregrinibacteria bacterium]|nr:septum formation protein Maf [Candidatus Peregrinibacteria bacterium]
MTPSRIILASRSPARKKLLEKLGIPFECHASHYVEDMNAYKTPKRLAVFLALQKARSCYYSFPSSRIIGADTFITVGKEKIGKPSSHSEAKRILANMSGKTIKVHSGVAVITTDEKGAIMAERADYAVTFLKIKKMSEREIERLAHQKDALNISGAFSIEGEGGKMVESISGDYDNVIGLPVAKLKKLLLL